MALLSAALRHARDAEALLKGAHQSVDQAKHLAGFGPECARKATLTAGWLAKPLGHTIVPADELMEFVVALDPVAHRYQADDWKSRYPDLASWSPQCRYDKTGTCPFDLASRVVEQARAAVAAVLGALWSDGRIPDGVLGRGGTL